MVQVLNAFKVKRYELDGLPQKCLLNLASLKEYERLLYVDKYYALHYYIHTVQSLSLNSVLKNTNVHIPAEVCTSFVLSLFFNISLLFTVHCYDKKHSHISE